jgi:hypothetical protein
MASDEKERAMKRAVDVPLSSSLVRAIASLENQKSVVATQRCDTPLPRDLSLCALADSGVPDEWCRRLLSLMSDDLSLSPQRKQYKPVLKQADIVLCFVFLCAVRQRPLSANWRRFEGQVLCATQFQMSELEATDF